MTQLNKDRTVAIEPVEATMIGMASENIEPAYSILEDNPGYRKLQQADRCDRCVQPAVVQTVFRLSGDLLFCGHHFDKHSEAIRKTALAVYDQRAS